MVDSYFVYDKQGVQALHHNADAQSIEGWSVLSGGQVSIKSGTLGTSDTVRVANTTILHDADVVDHDAADLSLPDSDSDPRWDLIYADAGGYDVISGPAEPADPEDATHTDTKRPAPPDLRYDPDTGATMDRVVPLALVWIPGGGQSVAAADIEPIRFGSDIHGGDGTLQTLQVAESPSTLTGVIRRAEHNQHLGDRSNPHSVTTSQIGAATVGALSSLAGDVELHVEAENNPHSVTASQVGAADAGLLTDHISDESNPHNVTANQADALSAQGGTVDGDVDINGTLGAEVIEDVDTIHSSTDGTTEIHTPLSGGLVVMDAELENEIMRFRPDNGRVTITREVEVAQNLTANVLEADDYIQFPVLDDDPDNAPDGAWWINGAWSPDE